MSTDASRPEGAPPTPKGRDSRARLLAAAAQLFIDRGYGRVRITDITAAADLSSGAFYRYFTDRRDIMLALLQDLANEVFDFVRVPWERTNPMQSVLASTRRYFEFYESHRTLFAILVELGQTDPAVTEIWARSRRCFYDRIAHALRRGIDDGLLRTDLDPAVAAEMLGSMTEFYAFQRFVLRDGVLADATNEHAAQTLAAIWTAGILQPPPGESR